MSLLELLRDATSSAVIGGGGRKQLQLPPGPKGWPVVGSSARLASYSKVWDAISDLHAEFGHVVSVQLGSRFCILVNSPEVVREVLLNRANQFANRPDFLRFHAIFHWNRHLSVALCDWSAKQRARRELLYGPLHPRNGTDLQARLARSVGEQGGQLVDALRRTEAQPLQPRTLLLSAIGNMFYDFFCTTTFDWEDEEFRRILLLYNIVFHELFQGFAIDFMPWLRPFYSWRLNQLHLMAKEVSAFTMRLVDEHEKKLRRLRQVDGRADARHVRDITDILVDYMLSTEGSDDNDETQFDHLDISAILEDLIGGFPVVANMLQWGLWMIAGEPQVQEKVFKEFCSVCGSTLTNYAKHKNELVYTEAVVYEIVRIVCSPIIPHVATEDGELHGYYVPKDAMVMFNTCDINFDPLLWEEPEKFIPERFIRDGSISKPDFFFPFGTGKRSCMGDGLVRYILHYLLLAIFGHFSVELGPGTPRVDYLDARGRLVTEVEPELSFQQRRNTCS